MTTDVDPSEYENKNMLDFDSSPVVLVGYNHKRARFLFILKLTIAIITFAIVILLGCHYIFAKSIPIIAVPAPVYPFIPHTHLPTDDDEYIAICAVVRNQQRDLIEWFTHHYYHHGIRYFYIMDDSSVPALDEFTDYGIPKEAIIFKHYHHEQYPDFMYKQQFLYSECNRLYGDRHFWIGYIDADEYIEITDRNETLRSFLQSFEEYPHVGAVAMNWLVHTSSGHLTRQNSTRKAYTTCLSDDNYPWNDHIKSFVRPSYFDKPETPHYFFTKSPYITVGEKADPVFGSFRSDKSRNRIAVHHYLLMSKQDYTEKLERGAADNSHRNWELWDQLENSTHVPCMGLANYIP
jgi:hypothetical protein